MVFLLIIFDNEYRPDAGLYHIPYIQILNENKIIIVLSNLHSRFGHISILQYLSAFNFDFFRSKNGILIPSGSLVIFLYIYFFNDVLRVITKKDKTVTGFNIVMNNGEDAGQTVFHCHVHLIPRRKGDIKNPRGGVRGIIPSKKDY